MTTLLTLLDTRGTGAERQRRSWERARGVGEFIQHLADTTLTEPTPLPLPAALTTTRRE